MRDWSMQVTGFVVVVAIVCATTLMALQLVLDFGRDVLTQTKGKSESLRDAADLIRAFQGGFGGLLALLLKIFKRGG